MSKIEFRVDGKIVGKQRPRFNRHSGNTYTPSETQRYEKEVREAYRRKYPVGMWVQNSEQPISISCIYHFAMPASWSKKKKKEYAGAWCLKHIDLDNCDKSIADALIGTAYPDDSQICATGRTIKIWDYEEFVEVRMEELGEQKA